MEMTLLTGSANPLLAQATAERLGVRACKRDLHRFPEGELHVEIRESVRGHDVYLIQPRNPPAWGHLVELLMLAGAATTIARTSPRKLRPTADCCRAIPTGWTPTETGWLGAA
jgi:phosphoribosylpyrophosphate synthetase